MTVDPSPKRSSSRLGRARIGRALLLIAVVAFLDMTPALANGDSECDESVREVDIAYAHVTNTLPPYDPTGTLPAEVKSARQEHGDDTIAAVTTVRTPAPDWHFGGCSDDDGQFRVTTCSVTQTAEAVVLLPADADAVLIGHEMGHAELHDEVVGQLGEKLYRDACESVVGRVYPSAETAFTVVDSRVRTAHRTITEMVDVTQKMYERITDRGKSPYISTADAMRRVRDHFGRMTR